MNGFFRKLTAKQLTKAREFASMGICTLTQAIKAFENSDNVTLSGYESQREKLLLKKRTVEFILSAIQKQTTQVQTILVSNEIWHLIHDESELTGKTLLVADLMPDNFVLLDIFVYDHIQEVGNG